MRGGEESEGGTEREGEREEERVGGGGWDKKYVINISMKCRITSEFK